jgi:hypothetical protein
MSEFVTTEYGIMFLKYFFGLEGLMVFYHDFKGHFRGLKQEQNSSDWQLVIDSLQ